MGSGQSNLDPANIIKISQNVVERLERQQQSQNQPQKKTEEPKKTTIKNVETPKTNTNVESSVQFGPTLTSLRVLQMKEKEFSERENYWTERVQQFRKRELELSEGMVREFEKAEKEINKKAPGKPPGELKNYEEKKKNLLECYKKYPDQLLLCDREVAEFADSIKVGNLSAVEPSAAS